MSVSTYLCAADSDYINCHSCTLSKSKDIYYPYIYLIEKSFSQSELIKFC